MEFGDAPADDTFDEEGLQDEIVAMETDGVPQTTAEPATAGNAGDPLELLYKFHPETILDYAETIAPLLPLRQVPPSKPEDTDDLVDAKHISQPFLTIYEKTKILGFRANQLAQGARPYVVVPDFMTDTLAIAKLELEQRKLPFIVKRPMPDGTFEYWRLRDLMII